MWKWYSYLHARAPVLVLMSELRIRWNLRGPLILFTFVICIWPCDTSLMSNKPSSLPTREREKNKHGGYVRVLCAGEKSLGIGY